MTETVSKVRLDKWLWAARFYKTRGLAKEAIEGGKVHYDQQKGKPSRIVEIGAMIRLRVGVDEKTIIIDGVSDKRRGAPEAQLLYHETEESIKKREHNASLRKALRGNELAPERRPTKKQRRDIVAAKNVFYE